MDYFQRHTATVEASFQNGNTIISGGLSVHPSELPLIVLPEFRLNLILAVCSKRSIASIISFHTELKINLRFSRNMFVRDKKFRSLKASSLPNALRC
jgi:hypothetical protein